MVLSISAAPPYSVVFLSEPKAVDVSILAEGKLIAASQTVIAIGCLAEMDGVTQFFVGSTEEVDTGQAAAFVGEISTPGRLVSLQTVEGECLLEMAVNHAVTQIKIWVNDPSEPDRIVFGLS